MLFLADVEFLVTGKTSSKKSNHLKTITFLETAIENLKKDLKLFKIKKKTAEFFDSLSKMLFCFNKNYLINA